MASILMKSAIDTCISAICYYLVGYAFTVGQSNPTNGEIHGEQHGYSCRQHIPLYLIFSYLLPTFYLLLSSAFIGNSDFALSASAATQNSNDRELFVWTWVYCATSTTIMAGSIAERSTFISYILYAIFYASWVYPVPAYWSWSHSGWLSPYYSNAILGMGAIDFAGSGESTITWRCG